VNDRWTTARSAHGPLVVAWLDEHRIVPSTEALSRRMRDWRNGGMADIFTLDRLLTPTPYGLWELPDEVWRDVHPRTTGRRRRPKPKRYAQLRDRAFLYDAYVLRGLTSAGVAALVGCTEVSVRAALRRHAIAVRPRGSAGRIAA